MFGSYSNRLFVLWQKYEHHLGVAAIFAGFIFDLIIADRPDSIPNNILLLSYLFIAGATIVLLNIRAPRHREQEHSFEQLLLLLILQFCFGGLASNLLVLYGRSGTFGGSALFVGLLGALVLGNEFLRGRYALLRFNIVALYLLLLSYCVIAVPTFITHTIGVWVFLLSGAVSLGVVAVFIFLVSVVALQGRREELVAVVTTVGAIFVIFNLLYFLNVIPPVPLALKDIGIYHSLLRRSSGEYLAIYEKPRRYEIWRATAMAYTLTPGEGAFCFSSVFAPTELEAPIYHRWEYYNEETGGWETRSRVSFPISGGRSEGYRGFSTKYALVVGRWRCDVETSEGALIGRTGFTVVESTTPPVLSTKTL